MYLLDIALESRQDILNVPLRYVLKTAFETIEFNENCKRNYDFVHGIWQYKVFSAKIYLAEKNTG